MSRYIKREDAVKIIRESPFKKYTTIICYFVGQLNELQSADVVKVIRCEECKFYAPVNNGDHGYCGTPLGREVYPDDYCSKAERFI